MTKAELKNRIQALIIEDCESPQAFLERCFQEGKYLDPGLTYGLFSQSLGLGASNALYLMMKGQRPLTVNTAEKIASGLLTGFSRKYFLQMVRCQNAKSHAQQTAAQNKLVSLRSQKCASEAARNHLVFFTKWYHATILEILRLPAAQDNPEWLSQVIRPRVAKGKIEAALALLQDLGYLIYSKEKGRLVPAGVGVTTGAEAQHLAIAQYHRQMLELSRLAIESLAPHERDISALTFAVREDEIPALKAELAALRQKFKNLADGPSEKNQVVQVNMQMFVLLKARDKS